MTSNDNIPYRFDFAIDILKDDPKREVKYMYAVRARSVLKPLGLGRLIH
jgi:hypothetical protein